MTRETRYVALIDNPVSGPHNGRRESVLGSIVQTLEGAGVRVDRMLIDGPGSGGQLAEEAIQRGCDAVVVCGGDGTVHEVLQKLVGTPVALGVVPFGTANALASDLGLTGTPAEMIEALLGARRVEIPVGRIIFCDDEGAKRSRYFTVAAGVGADALLMSRLDPRLKRRFGYALYMVEAFRIWATHSFPMFEAQFTNGGGPKRVEAMSQLLAVRVRSFGGSLGKLAPGASLHSENLSLLAFKTRSRYRYMRFLLAVLLKRQTFKYAVELIEASAVDCHVNGSRARVMIEADGEPLGTLPARMEIAEQRLTLLIPANAEP